MRKSLDSSVLSPEPIASSIGTMGERSLLAGLKCWYADRATDSRSGWMVPCGHEVAR
ncbi:MAG TPA: hypothetical protein VM223_08685 [Planctomycetota bacterium]|nr:hypothetical protein [Planctomycetota bacterium]